MVVSYHAREVGFPAATGLALDTAAFLYVLGGVPLILGTFSSRVACLRRPAGPLGVMIAGFLIHLVFAYLLLMAPALLAAGGAPRRLPDPVRELLLQTDRLQLFSVTREPDHQTGLFHGFSIQSQTNLSGLEARTIAVAFVESFEGNSATVMMCFDPGFGMRAYRGEDRVDFVLCYECNRVLVVDGGKESEICLPSDTLPVIAKHFPHP